MRWQFHPRVSEGRGFASGLGISPVTEQVLMNRGITSAEDAARFLNPSLQNLHDPFLMADMEKAVARIIRAIEKKERITVYGDYDTDGVTSTALLLKFFGYIGVTVRYYIPHRIKDGYGLCKRVIDDLKGMGTELIITVDNGANACEQVLHANSLGIDVVVTDHHEVPARLPPACAVINPKRPDCAFPFKELAGVGVAFNLVMAVRQRLREAGFFAGMAEPRLRELLDIVALGTIADVVPLINENRIFVKFGIEELKQSSNRGIAALKIISDLEPHQINATTVAYRLAPRINAAGRIDDQNLGVELLSTTDPEVAATIAQRLNDTNIRRQALEATILKEAEQLIEGDPEFKDRLGLVLAREGWHPGVIGIVATRIAEAHRKPTVIIGIDNGKGRGSARSIGDYNIVKALGSCSDLLSNFGGHRHAAGVTIELGHIAEFGKKFDEIVRATILEDDLIEGMFVDAELDASEITEGLIDELERLAPFGCGNPEPVFCMRELKVADARIVKDKHLKLKFTENMVTLDAIGFDMAHHGVEADDILDVAFIPQHDTWRGNRAVQLKLRDLKVL